MMQQGQKIRVGDRVIYINPKGILYKRTGTVEDIVGDTFHVRMDHAGHAGKLSKWDVANVALLPQEHDKKTSQLGITKACTHSWKEYKGLFEVFEYCEKCDQKKPKVS